MANKFKDNEKRPLVAPGSKPNVEEKVVEPTPVVEEKPAVISKDVLNNIIAPKKPTGSARTFYLSEGAQEKLDRYAKENKTNPSKALDALLNAILE
jgi:hypothetical protein